MDLWMAPAVRAAAARLLRGERGQTELIIIALLLFLIFLVSTGRRVVVQ
ncbi:MAG: hypothetical protein QN174_07485 [Armatimonadota bacterium]|nr:hypothetical protein [Armatimonadota bacterium]MDR7422673.1 hypothetical protein [Armatimonadota bacterium]MDR7456912.1 hypothetical protein [Armatimonadota bacterium]MDR7496782.1 hypothetical protein [Armatimonadota bacterium]MDR7511212.1 hypothetical protein [Armatimonadota bacterium]